MADRAAARRPPRAAVAPRLALDGELWLSFGGQALGGSQRFALLRAVAEQGSITHAAKAAGLSYKGAWDTIDAMNRAAGRALVERCAGGRGGGSTRLTAHGARLLQRYEQIAGAHRRFLQLLAEGPANPLDLDVDFSLLGTINMKTSARNQFVGTVTLLRSGAVNDEVELTLPGGQRIVAVLTRDSTLALGLRNQMTAIALVKSSSVLVATTLDGARLSARNQLPGTVAGVKPGAVNDEVIIHLDGGGQVAATITHDSARALGLAPGVRATAVFDASSVILAVVA